MIDQGISRAQLTHGGPPALQAPLPKCMGLQIPVPSDLLTVTIFTASRTVSPDDDTAQKMKFVGMTSLDLGNRLRLPVGGGDSPGQVTQASSDVKMCEDPREVKFEGDKHGAEHVDTSQTSCVAHTLPGLHREPAHASDVASLKIPDFHANVNCPKHMQKD
ncbi:hypothetical protein llap_3157 [Limosa lapponica baueri]|uniref:Uncharacterized protein n=1 Tax=Limosa lapponica baueri TaxID=1758121 RepID=A0A2I0UKG1_LIMLA|nr:hypothetical protein llap_3157 [Limosa lapponica baueri]